MARRLLVASILATAAGALGVAACVGDSPVVTPGLDAATDTGGGGKDVSSPDATGDGGTPLVACKGNETLETFDDPMNQSSNTDLCLHGAMTNCDFASGNGLSYASQELKAAATTTGDVYALASRAHQQLAPVLARVTEATVTYEVSIDQLTGDAGWHGLGCLLDQDDVDDAGTGATKISRVDVATNGTSAAAFAYVNGTHAGQTPVALTGYTSSSPMKVTIHIDRRSAPKATVSLSSTAGTSTVNLNPAFGTELVLWCGTSHESAGGTSKVTLRNIRYARCLKP